MDHVLYFVTRASKVAREETEEALRRASRRLSPSRADRVRLSFETSPVRALAKLRSGGADALILDTRGEVGGAEESLGLSVLRGLFDEHAAPRVIGRERVIMVVDGDARGAALAFEAGRLHLGAVVTPAPDGGLEPVWERLVATTASGRGGKVALCLAGGGTEGLLYELGVLRALDRFLPASSLANVDIICGISAGAILGGLLANGISPKELSEGLKEGSDRLLPIKRTDLFDLNVEDLARRAASLSWDVVRGKRSPISALFRLPPAGVFSGKRLGKWLESMFTRPGMINRFADLPHKLFIGATDQDTSEHVLFGSPSAPTVPIHTAIRASTALAPFYAPEKIDGRYYVDGGFTRTTNMRVAVQEGATLVILVDPMVPIRSNRPGHVQERGAIYGAMQGLKSLINGRFDKAVPTLRAMYPQVAFHLFQPGEGARRVMAGSPMKYFFREEIEELAYRETVREIHAHRFEMLARDFGRHGLRFEEPQTQSIRAVEMDPLGVVA